jgi:cellulose/xylan binding protein with CBM9 domain
MARLPALLLLLPFAGCAAVESEPAQPGKEPAVDRVVECRWARNVIKLDGVLNEVAWDDAQVLENFVVYWQKRKAKTATKARLLWDNDYFYFCAEMVDSDLYADVEKHNGITWENDVFEIFLKPAEDKLAYYEFQVNAANTQLEMFLPSRGAGGYRRFAGEPMGMESAVRLEGTLNKWDDKDKGWTVEGKIPWTAFKPTGGRPAEGSKWKFALCRYDYSVEFDRVETSSTAPLTVSDFHRYEDYAELRFLGRNKK